MLMAVMRYGKQPVSMAYNTTPSAHMSTGRPYLGGEV